MYVEIELKKNLILKVWFYGNSVKLRQSPTHVIIIITQQWPDEGRPVVSLGDAGDGGDVTDKADHLQTKARWHQVQQGEQVLHSPCLCKGEPCTDTSHSYSWKCRWDKCTATKFY